MTDHSPTGMTDRLVLMLNQIATFFASQPGSDQAERVAQHLRDYWDPRMRAGLAQHLSETGGAGLSPLALRAAQSLG